ncbi:MAG: ROK family transcriptional regulator [Acidimicrobiales bacterium]|jgi:predicted NBD/HSP70 family sugar kinase/biotin operon repressor
MPNQTGRALPSAPARQQLLKRHNLSLVLRQIAASRSLSRAQLAARTGLTKATVSTLADALIDAGLVVERDPERGLIGRPGSPLNLNPRGPAGLGMEINVDYVSCCVVDLTGSVRFRQTIVGDNRLRRPEVVLRRAVRAAGAAWRKADAAGLTVFGLGVGVPGLVDFEGVLHRAPNLVEWQGIPLAEVVADMIGRPLRCVYCDNEANLAALGERWFGRRDDLQDFVFVSGEIGVGAGIVIGGELFRGVRGLGGELGHVTVDPMGPECSCGGRGCLERVAGQEALFRAAGLPAKAGPASANSLTSVAEIVRRAITGDPRTLLALEKAGTALGIALSAFLNVLDLPTVVLGGLYAELAPWLIGPVTAELHDRVVNHSWSPIEVVVSSLGGGACVRGAAGVTIRRIIDDPVAVLPEALTRT